MCVCVCVCVCVCMCVSRRVGLVVSVSASHVVGRRFAPGSGPTKDHHKDGTNSLPAWYACVREAV